MNIHSFDDKPADHHQPKLRKIDKLFANELDFQE